ncbi:hypothetical protein LJB81_00705 [Desulfovibrio sp. OttesenSCG-928-M14]|nr:hypothetical protein [Desulfovibrio sp. OttesenSCG-928-M14]
MNTQSFYTRQMLLRYSRQLVTARRIARYDRLLGRSVPAGSHEAETKRKDLIERVAREIMENLIFSGSDNPIVREVRDRLDQEMGEELIFRYPPAEQDIQIFRKNETGHEVELPRGEKQTVMGRLWDVTLQTVDATML